MISLCFIFFSLPKTLCYHLNILISSVVYMYLCLYFLCKTATKKCYYLHDREIVAVLSAHLNSLQNYSREFSIFLLIKGVNLVASFNSQLDYSNLAQEKYASQTINTSSVQQNIYSLPIRTMESLFNPPQQLFPSASPREINHESASQPPNRYTIVLVIWLYR